jgi:hypothetical protein
VDYAAINAARRTRALEQLRNFEAATKERNTRTKAIAQLRQVEAETKERNEKRKEAAEAAAKKPAAAEKKAMGGAGGAPEPEESNREKVLVQNLPEAVKENIQSYVGESDPDWNLARLFLLSNNPYTAFADAAMIVCAIGEIAKGQYKFNDLYEATAKQYGRYFLNDSTMKDVLDIFDKWSKVSGASNYGFKYKQPEYVEIRSTKTIDTAGRVAIDDLPDAQERMLSKGFNDNDKSRIDIRISRRAGGMFGKAGIKLEFFYVYDYTLNIRTKAGRDERDKQQEEHNEYCVKKAREYLKRINDKAIMFGEFMVKHYSRMLIKKQLAKAKKETERDELARATRAEVKIYKKEDSAAYISPGDFESVLLAYKGNAEMAEREAKKLRAKYPGRRIKFWMPRTVINIKVEEE